VWVRQQEGTRDEISSIRTSRRRPPALSSWLTVALIGIGEGQKSRLEWVSRRLKKSLDLFSKQWDDLNEISILGIWHRNAWETRKRRRKLVSAALGNRR
jgi:hypothetical protein